LTLFLTYPALRGFALGALRVAGFFTVLFFAATLRTANLCPVALRAGVFAGAFLALRAFAGGGALRTAVPERFGSVLALVFFFGKCVGLASFAAFALLADEEDSALRRDVLAFGGVAAGRFEVLGEALGRFFGPRSRVPRPSRRPPAISASSGSPSSARL
jgi:hypothetical protein